MLSVIFRLLTTALSGLAPLLACASIATAEGTVDLSKVILRIGDQTGATQSKLNAAGLLKDVPYKIEWSVYPAAVNLHEALKAGAVDTGLAGDAPTVSAIAGGSQIQVVAAWSNGGRGSTVLIVPHDSPITRLDDLRGKIISPTTRGSVGHFLVIGALKKAGLTPADVRLAFLSPTDASAAFTTGSIDAWAIWGVYRAHMLGPLKARILENGEGINSGLFALSATKLALGDPGKAAAIADFADRVDSGYQWTRDRKDDYISWYLGFSKQDRDIAAALYSEEASSVRVPTDDHLAAQLQHTYQTWVEGGVLKAGHDLGPYLYRNLKVASAP